MPAPCAACCRCASQRGAAVLMALLTLTLVAALTAYAVADFGAALDAALGQREQQQARWLARGAIDWARNVLAEDARNSATDHGGEAWAMRVPPTAVEEGEVGGEIEDWSGRLDLNRLLAAGVPDPAQLAAYRRLLASLGVPARRIDALTEALLDWLDSDEQARAEGAESAWYQAQAQPYRAGNGPLAELDELTLVRGYDAALVARLRPHAAALPAPAPLNVNTASAEVLAATLPGLDIDAARELVARRQALPCRDLAEFNQRLPATVTPAAAGFAVASRYFLVAGRAKYGRAVTRVQVLLDRKTHWPDIVWQKLL